MNKNKISADSDIIFSVPVSDLTSVKTLCQRSQDSQEKDTDVSKKVNWLNSSVTSTTLHYICLFILGLITWGLLWSAWGEPWRWDGEYFRLAAVVVTAWASGDLLQGVTGLPPVLAALLTGILARHFNVLDMRNHTHIDMFLRNIYPVVVLGKGSLAWDLPFMRRRWARVASLGVLPWTCEVTAVAICTHYLFGFPPLWGFLLGAVYSSVSGPVVMPAVQRAAAAARAGAGAATAAGGPADVAQLVGAAGGIDTALSVGVYGILHSFMFHEANTTYRYVKAGVTLLAGVLLGAVWGCLAGLMPHSRDTYVTVIRILFVLVGTLFANFLAGQFGWGGLVGVATLVCNALAAHFWSKEDWPLNKNPAATSYRILWALCEPTVFAYTGTFIVLSSITGTMVVRGLVVLVVSLAARLAVAGSVCICMPLKHRLFVCCAFTPKAVVEAVIGPLAINTLLISGGHDSDKEHAEDLLRLLVEAIFITTPLGFLLTHHLGPWLLQSNSVNSYDVKTNVENKDS